MLSAAKDDERSKFSKLQSLLYYLSIVKEEVFLCFAAFT